MDKLIELVETNIARLDTRIAQEQARVAAGGAADRPDVNLPRGVYRAPYTTAAGALVLFAVRTGGVRLLEREVPPDGDAVTARRKLWRELDRLDPAPDR